MQPANINDNHAISHGFTVSNQNEKKKKIGQIIHSNPALFSCMNLMIAAALSEFYAAFT